VAAIKEDIDYYVNENQAVDFTEDEDIYNDLNLQDEEDLYGVGDNDLQSSLDAQSVTEEHPPTPQKEETPKPKEPSTTNRRASVAATRPVVTSTTATVPPLPSANGVPKPASQATRPPTELKYASAVAAATNPASLLGLGPLPPPAATAAPIRQASVSSIGSSGGNPVRASSPVVAMTNNTPPTIAPSVPAYPLAKDKNVTTNGSPQNVSSPSVAATIPDIPSQPQPRETIAETTATSTPDVPLPVLTPWTEDLGLTESPTTFTMNGSDEADIAMLPPGLRDLLRSFQTARSRAQSSSVSSAPLSTTGKMLEASRLSAPDSFDTETKRRYVPQTPYPTPSYYPQIPHPIVTDPNFVRRCEVDTLFFMFYYQQETIQQ
jgi:CCR4-NOT transcription complex subunit 3